MHTINITLKCYTYLTITSELKAKQEWSLTFMPATIILHLTFQAMTHILDDSIYTNNQARMMFTVMPTPIFTFEMQYSAVHTCNGLNQFTQVTAWIKTGGGSTADECIVTRARAERAFFLYKTAREKINFAEDTHTNQREIEQVRSAPNCTQY